MEAQVYSRLKTLNSTSGTPTSGTTHDRGDVILVGRGGGGKGGGGGGGGGGVITVLTAAAKPCQAVVTTAAVRLIAAEVATIRKTGTMAAISTTANNRWYGGAYAYGYGYGNCARQQALITGSSYWWSRYYDCIY